jgi:hypothetical protein
MIQRWTPVQDYANMATCEQGGWVDYDDHLKEVKGLKEALKESLSALEIELVHLGISKGPRVERIKELRKLLFA